MTSLSPSSSPSPTRSKNSLRWADEGSEDERISSKESTKLSNETSLLDSPSRSERPQVPGGAGTAPAESIGSAEHHLGRCKPCAFFRTRGCLFGPECQFCHLCPPGEKHKRKMARRKKMYNYNYPSSRSHSWEAPEAPAEKPVVVKKVSGSTLSPNGSDHSEDFGYSTASSDSPRQQAVFGPEPVVFGADQAVFGAEQPQLAQVNQMAHVPVEDFQMQQMFAPQLGVCYSTGDCVPAMRVNVNHLPPNATLLSTSPVSSVTTMARGGGHHNYLMSAAATPMVYAGGWN